MAVRMRRWHLSRTRPTRVERPRERPFFFDLVVAKVSILIRLLVEVDDAVRMRTRRHGDLSAMITAGLAKLDEETAAATARRIYAAPPPRRFATATTVSLLPETVARLDELKDELGYYRSELINIALAALCESDGH